MVTIPAELDAEPARARRPAVLAVVFAALAIAFLFEPFPFERPHGPAQAVPTWAYDPTPVRKPKPRPEYMVAGFTYRCSDCHRIIASPPETVRTLTQHTEIELKHGINTRCLNCHHRTRRDVFAGDGAQEIPWNQPQLLCAKCHGPVYRDWQHGAHGRSNGYWDTRRGEQTRRKCIECHDPHQPPFPPMHPAPPPRTLRAGPPEHGDHGDARDPLRPHLAGETEPSNLQEH